MISLGLQNLNFFCYWCMLIFWLKAHTKKRTRCEFLWCLAIGFLASFEVANLFTFSITLLTSSLEYDFRYLLTTLGTIFSCFTKLSHMYP